MHTTNDNKKMRQCLYYQTLSAEEQFCYTAANSFQWAQRSECKIGVCCCITTSENDGVRGLARNIAWTLIWRATKRDELPGRYDGGFYGNHCGGVASTLRILRRMMRETRERNPDLARALLAQVWQTAGPELTGHMRSLRARACARVRRLVRRWVRQTRVRLELARILDGTTASSAAAPLLLQLLHAPAVGKDGRRDIHDAARTVHTFLAPLLR